MQKLHQMKSKIIHQLPSNGKQQWYMVNSWDQSQKIATGVKNYPINFHVHWINYEDMAT